MTNVDNMSNFYLGRNLVMNKKNIFRALAVLLFVVAIVSSPKFGLLPFWVGLPVWFGAGTLAIVAFSKMVVWKSIPIVVRVGTIMVLLVGGIMSFLIVSFQPSESEEVTG